MPSSYTCLYYHIIFSTKDRRPQITIDMQQRLYDYIGGIIANHKGKLLTAGGTADHVHLLASLSAQVALSDIMRLVKANSSRWIHETFPDKSTFGWQDGFGAFSVSHSNMEDVERYIAAQDEHHRQLSFQDEFVAFLQRHRVEHDQRHIWV